MGKEGKKIRILLILFGIVVILLCTQTFAYELKNLRTYNSQTFVNEDGVYTTQISKGNLFFFNGREYIEIENISSPLLEKKDIILYTKPFRNVFSFGKFEISSGIRPEIVNGNLELIDANDNTMISLPRPYSYDSKNNTIENDFVIDFNEKNRILKLYVKVDKSWLRGASYPVVVDPTVVLSNSTGLYDGYVYQKGLNYNRFDKLSQISAGLYEGGFSGDEKRRGFLEFDTSSIPDSAIIQKVELNFTVEHNNYEILACPDPKLNITRFNNSQISNLVKYPNDNIGNKDLFLNISHGFNGLGEYYRDLTYLQDEFREFSYDLGIKGVEDLTSQLPNNFFALGFKASSESCNGDDELLNLNSSDTGGDRRGPKLTVTYISPCGNGIIGIGEECDTTNINGQTCTPDYEYEYGGYNDTWGLGSSLTPAIVNDPNFGVWFDARIDASSTDPADTLIDYIRMRVYYTDYNSIEKYPGTVVGSWQNIVKPGYSLENIKANDGKFTSYFSTESYNPFVLATNFGFNIPSSATITGIKVTIEKGEHEAGTPYDNSVLLYRNGASLGENKAKINQLWNYPSTGLYDTLACYPPANANECRYDLSNCNLANPICDINICYNLPSNYKAITSYYDGLLDKITIWDNLGRVYLYNGSSFIFLSRWALNAQGIPISFIPVVGVYYNISNNDGKVLLFNESGASFISNNGDWNTWSEYTTSQKLADGLPQNFKPIAARYSFLPNDYAKGYVALIDAVGQEFRRKSESENWYNATSYYTIYPEYANYPLKKKLISTFYYKSNGLEHNDYLFDFGSELGYYRFDKNENKFLRIIPKGLKKASIPNTAYFDKFNNKTVVWFGNESYESIDGMNFKIVNCGQNCKRQPPTCLPRDGSTCSVPNDLGDTRIETITNTTTGFEESLQDILNSNGYDLNTSEDQTNIQRWDKTGNAEINVKLLAKNSSSGIVFGYYINGDFSTFKPIFKTTGPNPTSGLTPIKVGDEVNVNIRQGENYAFAIIACWGECNNFSTENRFSTINLKDGNNDHVLVFDYCDQFLLGFEDSDQDQDFQDIVVKISINKCDLSICGNGIIEYREECDEGDLNNGDGCDNLCRFELQPGINRTCNDIIAEETCVLFEDSRKLSDSMRQSIHEKSMIKNNFCFDPIYTFVADVENGGISTDVESCGSYIACSCFWDATTSRCQERVNISVSNPACAQTVNKIEDISCIIKTDNNARSCTGGVDEYTISWTSSFNNNNIPNPSNLAQTIINGCMESGEKEIPCPKTTSIPFIDLKNILSSLLLIFIIYLVLYYLIKNKEDNKIGKKESKNG